MLVLYGHARARLPHFAKRQKYALTLHKIYHIFIKKQYSSATGKNIAFSIIRLV